VADPFNNPAVGRSLVIKTPSGEEATLTCTAWGKAGSRWYWSRTRLHYTNHHDLWRKYFGSAYTGLERESLAAALAQGVR
jgi:hypothetical protein